jgi:hypothetical protein
MMIALLLALCVFNVCTPLCRFRAVAKLQGLCDSRMNTAVKPAVRV